MEAGPRSASFDFRRQPTSPLTKLQRPGDLALGSQSNQKVVKALERHRGMVRMAGFVKSRSAKRPTVRRSGRRTLASDRLIALR